MALLDRLDARVVRGDLDDVRTRAGIVSRSLRHQIRYLDTSSTGLRDAAMADMTALVIELGGPGQAAVWGHDGHIANEPDGGTESLGQHLARRFPDYVPIAFLSYDGSARAWDEAGAIGVIARDLGPAPAYTVEAAVMKITGSPEIAWVRIDQFPTELAHWLELPRFVRELGSAFRPNPRTLRWFPTAFSALVVIKRAVASTPTATGVRKATP